MRVHVLIVTHQTLQDKFEHVAQLNKFITSSQPVIFCSPYDSQTPIKSSFDIAFHFHNLVTILIARSLAFVFIACNMKKYLMSH